MTASVLASFGKSWVTLDESAHLNVFSAESEMTQAPSETELHVGDTASVVVKFERLLANGRRERYDPPQVYVQIETPDGVQTEYVYPTDVTRLSEGLYRRYHNCAQEGPHWGRGRGTDGTITAATADVLFTVQETRF